MIVYLIRHAQSTNNALQDATERVSDAPLTELGHYQARQLAEHLAGGVERVPPHRRTAQGYGIQRLFCSPMWRSLQTAEPIGQALGLSPEVWVELHEQGGVYLDHGEPEGKVGYPGASRSEIARTFPNYVLPDAITEEGWWGRPYEDMEAAARRAVKVAQQLWAWAGEETRVALVTHGTFMSLLLKAILGLTVLSSARLYHVNTGITRVELMADGRVNLIYLNRADHLPPEAVTW